MVQIYDTANQLEKEIRESVEFNELKTAFANLREEQAAYELFKEFQVLQQGLQQKMMAGEEITDDVAASANEMAEKIQADELISALMEKEQAFSTVVNDLNRIIMTPVRELYNAE